MESVTIDKYEKFCHIEERILEQWSNEKFQHEGHDHNSYYHVIIKQKERQKFIHKLFFFVFFDAVIHKLMDLNRNDYAYQDEVAATFIDFRKGSKGTEQGIQPLDAT